MKNIDLDKLKDIKDIIDLKIDFLPYILIGVAIISLFLLIFFLLKLKGKKKLTKKEKIKKYLKKYNYNQEAKKIAYDFSILVKEVIDKKDLDEYNKIVNELEKYKYKKKVPSTLPKDLIEEIKEFIRVRV